MIRCKGGGGNHTYQSSSNKETIVEIDKVMTKAFTSCPLVPENWSIEVSVKNNDKLHR